MPVIKALDIAFGRVGAPDLDRMEEFLTHFGLVRAARTPSALYMRGSDPPHHIHVSHKGEPRFIGFAYEAASEEDLERVSRAPGASAIEAIDEPGGGKRVRLTEPNGYQIEVVHGIERLPPLEVKRQKVNSGAEPYNRVGEVMRLPTTPTPVKRIGHGVLGTPRVKETVAWFRETLGLLRSDDVYAGDKSNVIGAFSRCDRGAQYVDHHVLFCVHNERAGLNHISYEVHDIDQVFMEHAYMASLGKYEHMWGVGRHRLGSQVFDYWADPWGRVIEHWADTDRLNAANGGNLLSVEEGFGSQWGDPIPPKLLGHVSP
jgi:catechol 2,3-dioxygenase-like lactoylglutathione lyase family enzyme